MPGMLIEADPKQKQDLCRLPLSKRGIPWKYSSKKAQKTKNAFGIVPGSVLLSCGLSA